jgi:uncharacterized protein involved in outer membrane biogenesis
MMKFWKIVGWTTLSLGTILIVFVGAITAAMIFGVTVNLDGLRNQVDAAATKALGRNIVIEGSVELVISFQPSLEINVIHIGNPEGWQTRDLARVEQLRGAIDIIPLLRGKIQIGEIRADGVLLSLETTASGKNNWQINIGAKPQPAETQVAPSADSKFSVEFVELRELALYDVAVIYRDGGLNKTYQFRLDALDGTAETDEPMLFSIWGSYQLTPFSFTLKGDPLAKFLDPADPWKMLISGKIDESPIRVDGSFHPQDRTSEASLQIDAEKVSLGGLLKALNLGDNMEVELDHFSVQIDAQGGNLKEIIEQSNFSSTIDNGHWFWPDPENQVNMDFAIVKGVIRSPAWKPIKLELEGKIQQNPFSLSLKGDPFAKLALTDDPWDMELIVNLSESSFRGNAKFDNRAETPEVVYELVSENLNLGLLMQQFGIHDGINAKIDKFQMNIIAKGSNPRELIELSQAKFLLENSRYVQPILTRDEDLKLVLTQGSIELEPQKPLKMEINGEIDREPYSVTITGGSLESLLLEKKSWRIDILGKFSQAPMRGSVTWIRPKDLPEARIEIETGKIGVGNILDWMGIAKGINAHVGSMRISSTARGRNQLELFTNSDFEYTLKDGYWSLENPNMKSKVDVVIKEFKVKRPAGKPVKLETSGHLAKVPAGIDEVPVKFQIQATARQKKAAESASDLTAWTAKRYYQLDVNGKIAGSSVALKGSLDQRYDVPAAALDLITGPINIGSILSWLEIVQGMEATVGGVKMHIAAKGNKIEDVLSQSNFSASIKDGLWTLRDLNTQASAEIDINRGTIKSLAGKPISFALDGRLEKTPITINIDTESLAAFARKIDHLPLNFKILAAGARLNLKTDVQLPIKSKNMSLQMDLKGDMLNSLDDLLNVSLPPIGPYSMGGRFAMDEKGYRISEFEVRVGQSDLRGSAVLNTTGAKPDLNIELATEKLQINDFDFGEWSAVEPASTQEKKEAIDREKGLRLLSPEVMQSCDARIAVNVNEVLSGNDLLGGGSVLMMLNNGRMTVDPLRLDIPGGAFDMSFAYEPTDREVLAEAFIDIEKFDFGILARRAKEDTKMQGLLSLDVNLSSRAPSLNLVMHNVNGHIDFAIWPQDIEAGIIDLWAVNLFTAILPEVDKEKTSKINCIIGQYSLKDGLLREDRMFIDTTRMRVKGDARVDFKKEDVYLYLKSRGKRPEFFSLATPIEVKGDISDFKIGVAPGGLIGTTIRFITSPLHVPLRRLFSENLPPEGSDICESPLVRQK